MSEILQTIATYAVTAIGSYTALMIGAQLTESLASEKIESQEQLDKIVEEEAKKLDIDPRLVVGRFYSNDDRRIRGARCYIDDFDFEERTIPMKVVEIKQGWGARRGAVRHELYHLKNHFPLPKNKALRFLRGFFYEEPTATLYAITGVKL